MCQEKLSLKTKRFRRMASGHCQVQIENVTVYMFIRDGPLENLWGGAGEVQKKIRAREN